MAKGSKTFSDKLKGKDAAKGSRHVRVIRSVKDPENGAIRFLDQIAKVPQEGEIADHLSKFLKETSPGS